MPEQLYYSYGGKSYRIRQKNIRGANGAIYPKYVVSLPVGYDICSAKIKYSDYTANSVDSLISQIDYDIGSGAVEAKLVPSKITVRELSERWMNLVQPVLAEGTRIAYRTSLKNIIYPIIGDKPAKEGLCIDEIQMLINRSYAMGYKEQTLKRVKFILSGIIDYGVENKILFSNPAKYLQIPKTPKHEYNILDREQMKKLLEIASKYKYGNIFAVCMLGAMRKSECLGLAIQDVNVDTATINIHQQLLRRKIHEGTKNGLNRKIVLPDAVRPFLKDEQEKQREAEKIAGKSWNNRDGLFFTGPKGRPVIEAKMLEDFKLMLEELGVDNFRFHDLRHTMATAIVNQSGDIYEAQRYLGHKHISTTKGYLHSTNESRQEIVKAMNRFLQ